ncbi:MAG TPA: hypothetical protein VGE26_04350 [Sphingobacteriaceae bacterium]
MRLSASIVIEILARLSEYNRAIGRYEAHTLVGEYARIETSNGRLHLPLNLILDTADTRQLDDPVSLKMLALTFRERD